MLGWPGSDWTDAEAPRPEGDPPVEADWQSLPGEVRHTFTHFHLMLTVRHARVDHDAEPTRGSFYGRNQFAPGDLPTVMRKAFDLTR